VAKAEWEKVGQIGVDAGLCMVGDPCYHLHRGTQVSKGEVLDPPHPEFGESWHDFCDKIKDVHEEGYEQVGRRLAVVTNTGLGDGVYDVFVRRDADGRIAAVKVEFLPEDEG
jgi:hypothetical protein